MQLNLKLAGVIAAALLAGVCAGVGGLYYLNGPTVRAKAVVLPAAASQTARPSLPPMDIHRLGWLLVVDQAHKALDDTLFDYPSTRFKEVRGLYYGEGNEQTDYVICGQLNTKNRMGAFTGYRDFALHFHTSGGPVVFHLDANDNSIVHDLCTGRGRAGEREAADNAALEQRIYTDTSKAGDEIIQKMRDLADGKYKPAPVLEFVRSSEDFTPRIAADSKNTFAQDAFPVGDYAYEQHGAKLVSSNVESVVRTAGPELISTYAGDVLSTNNADGVIKKLTDCYASASDTTLAHCLDFDIAARFVIPPDRRKRGLATPKAVTLFEYARRTRLELARHGIKDWHEQTWVLSKLEPPVREEVVSLINH